MGGKVNYKCKSRMFYEMQKVEDSFKYTEMELGSMVLASHVLSLPLSVKKLKPKKKLNQDVLKKVSRGLSRVEAGNPGFPRLVQVTSGGFSWWL